MSLDDKLREFVVEYGERACILLKAIYEESISRSGLKLGDFSVRGLKGRLKSWGVEYNPTPLLLKLEKELNLIETSYRSTTQRWWRIISREALEKALRMCGETSQYRSIDDPRLRLLRIQLHTLRPWEILETLRKIRDKETMTKSDIEFVKRIAFNELPLLIKIREEVESLEHGRELLQEEVEVVERIVEVVEDLVLRRWRGEERNFEVETLELRGASQTRSGKSAFS